MNDPILSFPRARVLERGWLSANNILFVAPECTTLIDSGYVAHAAQTTELVGRALEGRPLDRLLNTHLHSDHCGGNAALQARFPQMQILIPPGEAGAVADWDEDRLSYRATGQECPRFSFDGVLDEREIALGGALWEIHLAPGHDPHAVLFFEPASRTLISGDALWENGFGVIFPELTGEPSFSEVAATLDLIESLGPATVIPGHGSVFHDATGALAVSRRRLEAFVRSPSRHARHALKVLMKFKLLAIRRLPRQALELWWQQASYMNRIRVRFFPGWNAAELFEDILADLMRSGAVSSEGLDLLDGRP